MWKIYLILYPIFCLIGAGLEWCYGAFWNLIGTTPWTYPESSLQYTSIEGIPLWGFGGLICASIYAAIKLKSIKPLSVTAISLVLSVVWILLHSSLLQS